MAHKIIWSNPALAELRAISEFISRDSDAYAATVITEILDSVDRLQMFPRMGRRVPEWDTDDVREILVHKWRIVYQIGIDRIDIVDVIHGAQRGQGGQ